MAGEKLAPFPYPLHIMHKLVRIVKLGSQHDARCRVALHHPHIQGRIQIGSQGAREPPPSAH